jgi:secreted trypsin-like serine protease
LFLSLLTFGAAAKAVIGGYDLEPNEFLTDSVVGIYVAAKDGGGATVHKICTGSIITKTAILTAAHCVQDAIKEETRLIFASDMAEVLQKKQTEKIRWVENWMIHPDYNVASQKDKSDLAVIRIKGEIPAGFKPAKVVKTDLAVMPEQDIVVAGYGDNQFAGGQWTGAGRLRAAITKIVDLSASRKEVLIDQGDGKGACNGDSGGPLYFVSGERVALWGVVHKLSYKEDGQAMCNTASVATSIVPYANWIIYAAFMMDLMSPDLVIK